MEFKETALQLPKKQMTLDQNSSQKIVKQDSISM